MAAVQAWDEVFALVDCLGEAFELGAVPKEIRAHSEDHVDRQFLLPTGLEDEFNKIGSLFAGFGAALSKAEDFFKLIDKDQQVRAGFDVRLSISFQQAESAAAEHGAQQL